MACPFFLPLRKAETIAWIHPSRLPLGAGWIGECSAPGHEGAQPADEELREFCNMGYAGACLRLPRERACDAVRFAIAGDRGSQLDLCYVCEAGHRPVEHGRLAYDITAARWTRAHADPRIQRMAECYLESYLSRRTRSFSASATS